MANKTDESNVKQLMTEKAKERARERAKEKLKSIESGDFNRTLTSDKDAFSPPKKTTTSRTSGTTTKTRSSSTKSGTSRTRTGTTAKSGTSRTRTGASRSTGTRTTKSATEKATESQTENEKLVQELETISNANRETHSGRNKLIISILVVLIVLIWVFIIVMRLVKPQAAEPNCTAELLGSGKDYCELTLDGKSAKNWYTPEGIGPSRKYENFSLDLVFKEVGEYSVTFKVYIYNNDTLVENYGYIITDSNFKEKLDPEGDTYYLIENTNGASKVNILSSVVFNSVADSPQLQGLNSSKLELVIKITVEKLY